MANESNGSDDRPADVDRAAAAIRDAARERGFDTQVNPGQPLTARSLTARPLTAIVLGSGLGSLAERIESPIEIPFSDVPGCGTSTASGHRGQFILGSLESMPVVAMAGRLHRYEGWTNEQVTFPIRVMHRLGATRLIASNAAGGVNPKLRVGDLVVIRDHIDWLYGRPGQTTVSTSCPVQPASTGGMIRKANTYDHLYATVALSAARQARFCAIQGTYLATLGPTYETRAEYRMMRRIGADVVGMSTVGEVVAAATCSMRVLALSVVSNVADPDRPNVADHDEVLHAGETAAAKLECIVRRVLSID